MELKLNKSTTQLFDDCIKVNGVPSQIRQYYEELGELTMTIAKYQRAIESGDAKSIEDWRKELISEIADNLIMGMQFAYILGLEKVSRKVDFKLLRQHHRINNVLNKQSNE